MSERELPMLAGIAATLRWLEELAAILSGPLLTVGLGIALVDLLTDGRLLASQPALLYAWAVSQSIGVDAQLVGAAAKASAAIRARRPWVVLGYLALVALLAYVAYVASLVFATQEAQGLTTAQALARLGMSSTAWIIQRSALAVLLVVLSGFLRYAPPAKASTSDERAQLERELMLEPLRAQVRQAKAAGWRDLAGTITRRDAARPSGEPLTAAYEASGAAQMAGVVQSIPAPSATRGELPARPPTGPGRPARQGVRTGGVRTGKTPAMLRLATPSPEQRIRAVLDADPLLSVHQVARRAGVSQASASKWAEVVRAERSQVAQ